MPQPKPSRRGAPSPPAAPSTQWDAAAVRALRAHLGATQGELAEELGVRQQTVSEWETSAYLPRGASAKLLSLVAEQADFTYRAESSVPIPRQFLTHGNPGPASQSGPSPDATDAPR